VPTRARQSADRIGDINRGAFSPAHVPRDARHSTADSPRHVLKNRPWSIAKFPTRFSSAQSKAYPTCSLSHLFPDAKIPAGGINSKIKNAHFRTSRYFSPQFSPMDTRAKITEKIL